MDPDGFTPSQIHAIETAERVASVFSLMGTTIIMVTFLSSSAFRKPVNRLIFYTSWGNTLNSMVSLSSHAGIRAGQHSALCQLQAFFCQWFFPADVMWNLAMAINVYLTVFRKYTAADLRSIEWRYMMICYGLPLVEAFSLIFVKTKSRGRFYGPADIWCWISKPWDFMRIVCTYGPAWLCIICASTIYALAGRAIFAKRKQLRTFNGDPKSLATTITHTFTRHGDSAALDANKAAWVYTRSAILFLMSLLITWVPASIQRVSSLAHPGKVSYGMTVAAGLTLPLMGFWNSVIYLIVSHEAIKDLYIRHVKQRFGRHHDPSESARDEMGKAHTLNSGDSNRELDLMAALGKGSISESTQGLASNGQMNGSTV